MERNLRKERIGVVVFKHPLYKKTVKKTHKFKAHDENNECRVGDKVLIVETRKLSKSKNWRVAEIVEKAK